MNQIYWIPPNIGNSINLDQERSTINRIESLITRERKKRPKSKVELLVENFKHSKNNKLELDKDSFEMSSLRNSRG